MKEANINFLAASSVTDWKSLTALIANHKPSRATKMAATTERLKIPVIPNTGKIEIGIKKKEYVTAFQAVPLSFSPGNILNPARL